MTTKHWDVDSFLCCPVNISSPMSPAFISERLAKLTSLSKMNFVLGALCLIYIGFCIANSVLTGFFYMTEGKVYDNPADKISRDNLVFTFHIVEFWATFGFALVEVSMLAFSPRSTGNIYRDPFLLKILVSFNIISSLVPAVLISYSLQHFEVIGHELEYVNGLIMGILDVIVLNARTNVDNHKRSAFGMRVKKKDTILDAGSTTGTISPGKRSDFTKENMGVLESLHRRFHTTNTIGTIKNEDLLKPMLGADRSSLATSLDAQSAAKVANQSPTKVAGNNQGPLKVVADQSPAKVAALSNNTAGGNAGNAAPGGTLTPIAGASNSTGGGPPNVTAGKPAAPGNRLNSTLNSYKPITPFVISGKVDPSDLEKGLRSPRRLSDAKNTNGTTTNPQQLNKGTTNAPICNGTTSNIEGEKNNSCDDDEELEMVPITKLDERGDEIVDPDPWEIDYVFLASLVPIVLAIAQLILYNLGKKWKWIAHACEFTFNIISAVISYVFCMDNKLLCDRSLRTLIGDWFKGKYN